MPILTDILDVDEVIIIDRALDMQIHAQRDKGFDPEVHLWIDPGAFKKMFNAGVLHRIETGFWTYNGCLLWVEPNGA